MISGGYCSHNPETYKPKFHCRRQSGMDFAPDLKICRQQRSDKRG
nr:MAG TPA: hypothetical protein [Inoviridae sp.]